MIFRNSSSPVYYCCVVKRNSSILPLEQEQVFKENGTCDNLVYHHFKTKPVLHFQFLPEQAPVVRSFISHLDTYAQEYDLEESQDFYTYPITHDTKHEITKQLGGLCGCEIRARNQYLNNWTLNYPCWHLTKNPPLS